MKAVIVVEVNDDIDLSLIHANVELYPNELTTTYRGEPYYKGYLLKEVRPLPEKKKEIIVLKGHAGNIVEAYQQGWNNCIDAIFGEENVRR